MLNIKILILSILVFSYGICNTTDINPSTPYALWNINFSFYMASRKESLVKEYMEVSCLRQGEQASKEVISWLFIPFKDGYALYSPYSTRYLNVKISEGEAILTILGPIEYDELLKWTIEIQDNYMRLYHPYTKKYLALNKQVSDKFTFILHDNNDDSMDDKISDKWSLQLLGQKLSINRNSEIIIVDEERHHITQALSHIDTFSNLFNTMVYVSQPERSPMSETLSVERLTLFKEDGISIILKDICKAAFGVTAGRSVVIYTCSSGISLNGLDFSKVNSNIDADLKPIENFSRFFDTMVDVSQSERIPSGTLLSSAYKQLLDGNRDGSDLSKTAGDILESFNRAGKVSLNNLPISTQWYLVSTQPDRWWEPNGWTKIDKSHLATDFIDDIDIEYKVIDLCRDWLNTSWMKSKDWYLKGYKKEQISSGDAVNLSNEMLMPVVITQLLVTKTFKVKYKDSFQKTIDGMNVLACLGSVTICSAPKSDPSL
jgi:hypothetical protein